MEKTILNIQKNGKSIILGDDNVEFLDGFILSKQRNIFLNLDSSSQASEDDERLFMLMKQKGWLEEKEQQKIGQLKLRGNGHLGGSRFSRS